MTRNIFLDAIFGDRPVKQEIPISPGMSVAAIRVLNESLRSLRAIGVHPPEGEVPYFHFGRLGTEIYDAMERVRIQECGQGPQPSQGDGGTLKYERAK